MKERNTKHDAIIKEIMSSSEYKDELKKAKSVEDLLGKDGLMSKLFGKTLETMLESELTDSLGYAKHERSDNANARNGSYPRNLKTSMGNTYIDMPRDRLNEFEPQILQKYQTTTNELERKIISMYGRGITVDEIKESLLETYGMNVSPTLISTITDKVLPLAKEWQERPLEKFYPIIYLDCIHIKIRLNGKVEPRAVYIVLGINLEGIKDILGMYVSSGSEGASFWVDVIDNLKTRGIQDVLIACIDGLSGFSDAIKTIFPNTIVQRCIIHQIRNTLKYVSWKHKKEFMRDLKKVYSASNEEQAMEKFLELKEKWGNDYGVALKRWELSWEELSAYFEYPSEIKRLIYTTNIIESYNRQLRKVTKSKSVFPTTDSVLKMLYLATVNISKKWTMPIKSWTTILAQLAIKFENRINL